MQAILKGPPLVARRYPLRYPTSVVIIPLGTRCFATVACVACVACVRGLICATVPCPLCGLRVAEHRQRRGRVHALVRNIFLWRMLLHPVLKRLRMLLKFSVHLCATHLTIRCRPAFHHVPEVGRRLRLHQRRAAPRVCRRGYHMPAPRVCRRRYHMHLCICLAQTSERSKGFPSNRKQEGCKEATL